MVGKVHVFQGPGSHLVIYADCDTVFTTLRCGKNVTKTQRVSLCDSFTQLGRDNPPAPNSPVS